MTFWSGRRVLVTGCCGLIGGPLCKMLLEQNAHVIGYDPRPPGTLKGYGIAGQLPVIEGDVLNLEWLRDTVSMNDVQFIFHLAAVSGVEESRSDGYQAFDINTRGTLNALEVGHRQLIPIVVASSNHVYGEQESYPVKEDAPLNQLDTYSASKIAADYIARAYAHNYGVRVGVIRNTNCYGPYDPHEAHIIPATISALLEGRRPTIRSAGRTRKSYLYVDDVASAYLLVGHHIAEAEASHEAVFNVADASISVVELVNLITNVIGGNFLPEVLGEANDQHDEDLDSSRVRALGWKPQYTLEDGIMETADAFRQRKQAVA
jgi:CDP-glucose 4,6-dehydratase